MAKKKVTIQENGQEKVVEIDVPDNEAQLSWGDPAKFKILHQPGGINRLDGPWKVTGSAFYAADANKVTLPGLLFGRILRSPHAHARITSIDLAPAKAMPGVHAVMTLKGGGSETLYQGDEIAAVAAETPDIAEDAIRAIKVAYEKLPFVVEEQRAREADSPRVHSDRSNSETRNDQRGDVDAAFRDADAVHEGTYGVPARLHTCLETHGLTAQWLPPNHVKVWASTQDITGVKNEIAGSLGVPEGNVEVICEVMGGGFGSKFGIGVEGHAAGELSRQANAPVRMLLTRKEEYLSAGNAPSAFAHVKIAGKKDGTLTAFEGSGFGTGGVGGDAGAHMPYIYQFGSHRVSFDRVFTNTADSRAFRAPLSPQSSFLTELALDELAAKLSIDPLELRRKNASDSIRNKQYDIGAEKIGWTRRPKVPGSGPGPVKRGMGMAISQWGGGGYPGTNARVTINRDGSVVVEAGTQDIGTGTRTYVGAIVAEELHIPLGMVTTRIGDTNLGPGTGSGGSTTTACVAPSIKGAVSDARIQLLAAVAPSLNVQASELEMFDGGVRVTKTPDHTLTWKAACARLGAGGVTGMVNNRNWPSNLQQGGAAGAQFAEVAVDTRNGHIRVLHMVGVHDCGLVLNPKAVESQINGGMIMGIGLALLEGRIMDGPTGHMLNPNMEFYKIPGAMEIPILEPIVIDNPTGKVTGIGEPPNIPGASAIACAVFNAIGVAVRELPITPDKVLMALNQ